MLIRVTDATKIKPSEITDEVVFNQRREFLKKAQAAAITTAIYGAGMGPLLAAASSKLKSKPNPEYSDPNLKKQVTAYKYVTSYNNFYEFGTDKEDPAKNAKDFVTSPWSIELNGLVEKPATYHLEDFIKPFSLEDRIYRFRCVEAWSMVVPWLGFPLRKVIEAARPKAGAKYVLFKTLLDPKQMPGQRQASLKWPYREGLRLDEAMHDLSFLVVGAYGKTLPNQNGAPIRLIVPWKYGYKSIKSIVSITLTDKQPKTSWELKAPHEYPFYSNVLPDVPHPRWSQKRERVLGSGFFSSKKETLVFNGYASEVASMYRAFDNTKLY